MVLLLVDDSPDDIFLFRRALRSLDAAVTLVEVQTVTAASQYLNRTPPHDNAPSADIIVSDSVIDHESGADLLQWVRHNPMLKDIPFVLLTGNTDPEVLKRALSLGATKVLEKPAELTGLVKVARAILNILAAR